MEVLDKLFGKEEENSLSDINIQDVSESAVKNEDKKLASTEPVVEQVSEDENLTTCEKCDLKQETCEQELGTKCTGIKIREAVVESINITSVDAKALAKEVICILDSTPSTDFELVNLKSKLYSMMVKHI